MFITVYFGSRVVYPLQILIIFPFGEFECGRYFHIYKEKIRCALFSGGGVYPHVVKPLLDENLKLKNMIHRKGPPGKLRPGKHYYYVLEVNVENIGNKKNQEQVNVPVINDEAEIVFVKNPSSFFIHTLANSKRLQQLGSKLNAVYSGNIYKITKPTPISRLKNNIAFS